MLLENPVSTIKTCHVLNSTTLLPTEMGPLEYDCTETMLLLLLLSCFSSVQPCENHRHDLSQLPWGNSFLEGSNKTLYGP